MSDQPGNDQPAGDQPPRHPDQSDGTADTGAAPAGGGSAELGELREELARTQDRYKRAVADLDNYRKRTVRDGERREVEVRQRVLRDWLDAVDSVERALRIEPDDPGLTAVLAQMEQILGRYGVTRLDAAGSRFDPTLHEAIAVQPSADVPDQTVLEVARSGFVNGAGEVLRPAQVVVAKRPAGEPT